MCRSVAFHQKTQLVFDDANVSIGVSARLQLLIKAVDLIQTLSLHAPKTCIVEVEPTMQHRYVLRLQQAYLQRTQAGMLLFKKNAWFHAVTAFFEET
ncbi:hypothetical protein BA896_014735 [Janthinobacterium lividum]|uniref:Uncharacterized protein n=1 Tax=Janthinobacterium lividum TaxID=29581 RepID=A0A1E8PUD1_9BURK|nr:hypothetical protein BA896_014735 [Janthinobacterium lividum]